jgi:hypothetical protein
MRQSAKKPPKLPRARKKKEKTQLRRLRQTDSTPIANDRHAPIEQLLGLHPNPAVASTGRECSMFSS